MMNRRVSVVLSRCDEVGVDDVEIQPTTETGGDQVKSYIDEGLPISRIKRPLTELTFSVGSNSTINYTDNNGPVMLQTTTQSGFAFNRAEAITSTPLKTYDISRRVSTRKEKQLFHSPSCSPIGNSCSRLGITSDFEDINLGNDFQAITEKQDLFLASKESQDNNFIIDECKEQVSSGSISEDKIKSSKTNFIRNTYTRTPKVKRPPKRMPTIIEDKHNVSTCGFLDLADAKPMSRRDDFNVTKTVAKKNKTTSNKSRSRSRKACGESNEDYIKFIDQIAKEFSEVENTKLCIETK